MDTRKKSVGRPRQINISLVNAICRAVETDITPLPVICERFGIQFYTFRVWKSIGRAALDKSEADISEYEKLCRQLVMRLDELQKQHEQTLIETISEPSHQKTARLMLSLMPNWELVESVGRT